MSHRQVKSDDVDLQPELAADAGGHALGLGAEGCTVDLGTLRE